MTFPTSYLLSLIISTSLLAIVIYIRQRFRVPVGWPTLLIVFGVGMWWADKFGLLGATNSWMFFLFSFLPIVIGFFILYRSIQKAVKKFEQLLKKATPTRKKVRQPTQDDEFMQRVAEKMETYAGQGKVSIEYRTPSIFISYRRSDSADITGRIYDQLVQRLDKSVVFRDIDSIPLGVDFRTQIDKKIGECKVVLVVIGKDWLTAKNEQGLRRIDDERDYVYLEIEAALRREVPVIPVLVRGATMPKAEELPEAIQSLAYRNGTLVRPDPDFHTDIDRLVKGLEEYGWEVS